MWSEILLRIFDYAMERYDPRQVTELFDMHTSEGKLCMMKNVFGFNESIYKYMENRIGKFNPHYAIGFNKGKAEREETEIKNTLYSKSLTKKLKSLTLRINKLDKKLHIKSYKTTDDYFYGSSLIPDASWNIPRSFEPVSMTATEAMIIQETLPRPTPERENPVSRTYILGFPESITMEERRGLGFYANEMEKSSKGTEKCQKPKPNKLEEKRQKLLTKARDIENKIQNLSSNKQEGFLKKDEVSTLSDMLKKGFTMREQSQSEGEEGEEMKMSTRENTVSILS